MDPRDPQNDRIRRFDPNAPRPPRPAGGRPNRQPPSGPPRSPTGALRPLPSPVAVPPPAPPVAQDDGSPFRLDPNSPPGEFNFLVPQARPGVSEVIITGSGGQRTAGMAYTGPNPGIFTADSSGRGVAAALTTVDGQNFKNVFDAQRQAIPIPFDPGGRPTYLILFGTSIRERGEISVKIAGQNCPVTWSGAHPGMSGLDQINVQLPSTLRGVGKTWIFTDVGGLSANQTQIHMGN